MIYLLLKTFNLCGLSTGGVNYVYAKIFYIFSFVYIRVVENVGDQVVPSTQTDAVRWQLAIRRATLRIRLHSPLFAEQ